METKEKRKVGRPKLMDNGRRILVYIDENGIETASELGNGNVSAGIRAALEIAASIKENAVCGK